MCPIFAVSSKKSSEPFVHLNKSNPPFDPHVLAGEVDLVKIRPVGRIFQILKFGSLPRQKRGKCGTADILFL